MLCSLPAAASTTDSLMKTDPDQLIWCGYTLHAYHKALHLLCEFRLVTADVVGSVQTCIEQFLAHNVNKLSTWSGFVFSGIIDTIKNVIRFGCKPVISGFGLDAGEW